MHVETKRVKQFNNLFKLSRYFGDDLLEHEQEKPFFPNLW